MRSPASSPAVGRAQVALAAALVALGCATLPPPAPAPAAAKPVAADDVDLAIARDVLRRAERFKTSAVGESGARPRENEALCLLVAAGDEAGLHRLAVEATPAGQLFALAGLARVAPGTYAELLPAFRTRTDEVFYLFYCELGGKPAGELVRELEETALLDGVIDSGPWRGVTGLAGRGALVARLRDDDPWVRRAAARGLGELGPWALPAVEPLAAALRGDPSPHVRVAAARALRRLAHDGTAAAALREAFLASESPLEARIAAWSALRGVEPSDELRRALGVLLPLALSDPAPHIREWAYDELWDVPLGADQAGPFDARFHAAEASDANVGAACLEQLAELDASDAVIAATRSWLEHPEAVVRQDAAARLLARGPAGRSVLEAELGRLEAATARAIELAARLAPEVAPASLLEALRPARSRAERLAAARVARACETAGALAILVPLLADDDSAVAHAARELLDGCVLSEELADDLQAQLAAPDVAARVLAADALIATDGLFPEARAQLVEALGSSDDVVRRHATAALAFHDKAAVEHLDLLAEADPWTQLALALPCVSVEAARTAEPRVAQALRVLLELTRADDQELRRAAAAGLPVTAGTIFPELLRHPDPVVRFEAAYGLVFSATPREEVAIVMTEVVDALPDPGDQAEALQAMTLELDDGSPEQREAVMATLRRRLDDPLWSDQALAGLASVLGRPAALLEARSPRAVARLVEEIRDQEFYFEAPERDRTAAALEARLAIEHDPRLRYLLEEALADVRGL